MKAVNFALAYLGGGCWFPLFAVGSSNAEQGSGKKSTVVTYTSAEWLAGNAALMPQVTAEHKLYYVKMHLLRFLNFIIV